MYKIVGIKKTILNFKDGNSCAGCFLHVEEQRDDVEGVCCENFFISATKLGQYSPRLGDEIAVYYNRYGKVQCVVPKGFSPLDYGMSKPT